MKYSAEEFSWEHVNDYQLFVDATHGNNPLVVLFDTAEMELMYVANSEEFLSEVSASHALPLLRQTALILPQVDMVWYPEAIFDESMLPYYQQYVSDDGLSKVESMTIPQLGMIGMYRNDRFFAEPWREKLVNSAELNLTSILLKGLSTYLREDENDTLNFHFTRENFHVTYFDQGQFVYFNTFNFSAAADIKDFLQEFTTVLRVPADQVRCLLSGEIYRERAAYLEINSYFPTNELVDITEITGDAVVPGSLIEHQHALLVYYLAVRGDD